MRLFFEDVKKVLTFKTHRLWLGFSKAVRLANCSICIPMCSVSKPHCDDRKTYLNTSKNSKSFDLCSRNWCTSSTACARWPLLYLRQNIHRAEISGKSSDRRKCWKDAPEGYYHQVSKKVLLRWPHPSHPPASASHLGPFLAVGGFCFSLPAFSSEAKKTELNWLFFGSSELRSMLK